MRDPKLDFHFNPVSDTYLMEIKSLHGIEAISRSLIVEHFLPTYSSSGVTRYSCHFTFNPNGFIQSSSLTFYDLHSKTFFHTLLNASLYFPNVHQDTTRLALHDNRYTTVQCYYVSFIPRMPHKRSFTR